MKDALKIFKRNFISTLGFSSILSLFLIVAFGIIYLFLDLMSSFYETVITLNVVNIAVFIFIITIIFSLLEPFIYSMFACNGVLQTPDADKVSNGSFLRTYLLATKKPFRGLLRVFIHILISTLIYLVLLTLLLTICYFIMIRANIMNAGTLYYNYLSEINTATTNEEAVKIVEKYLQNADFIAAVNAPILYCNFASLFIACYVFVHNINVHSFKYFLIIQIPDSNVGIINYSFNEGMKKCKSRFLKDYYKGLYPLTILFVVLFAGIYFGLSFIPALKANISLLAIITIFITSIVMVFFLPYTFDYYGTIVHLYAPYIIEAFYGRIQNELEYLKNTNMVTEEDLSELNNLESKIKKLVDEADKANEKKEEKSEGKEKNNEEKR